MSAIHKALREADDNRQQNSKAQFNPLWKTEKKSNLSLPLYGVAVLFFVGAIALFAWPVDDVASTTAPPTVISTTNVIDNVNDTNEVAEETNTPVALIETDSLPDAVDSLQVPESEPPMKTEPTNSAVESTAVEQSELTTTTNKDQTNTAQEIKPLPAKRETVQQTSASTQASNTDRSPDIEPAKQTTVTSNQDNKTVIRSTTDQWQQEIERHISKGEIEQAELILKQWISTQPRDATPRIWLAKIYVNNGFYQAAEPLISDIQHPEAQGLLGIIYERTSRPALASNVFESLYRSSPEQGKWLLFWAINSENSGQLAKSSALYQNYIQVFSDDDVNLTAFASQRLKAIRGQ